MLLDKLLSGDLDYIQVPNLNMPDVQMHRIKIYDLASSVAASKFAMATTPDAAQAFVNKRTYALAQADVGSGHDCFLKGVRVSFNLTITIKVWTEAERYSWFDIVTSQSTMHRLKGFDMDQIYSENVDPRIIEIMKELQQAYAADASEANYLRLLESNPNGCKLTARISTNFMQLKTIYYQRRNHRLPAWRQFCQLLEELPYFAELVLGKGDEELYGENV